MPVVRRAALVAGLLLAVLGGPVAVAVPAAAQDTGCEAAAEGCPAPEAAPTPRAEPTGDDPPPSPEPPAPSATPLPDPDATPTPDPSSTPGPAADPEPPSSPDPSGDPGDGPSEDPSEDPNEDPTGDPGADPTPGPDDEDGPGAPDPDGSGPATGLAGHVWLDLDGDGSRESGEPGVPGVQVCASAAGDGAPACAKSGRTGTAALAALPAGTYRLQTALPAGTTATGAGAPVLVPAGSRADAWLGLRGRGVLRLTDPSGRDLDTGVRWAGVDGRLGTGDDVRLSVRLIAGSRTLRGLPPGSYRVQPAGGPASDVVVGSGDRAQVSVTGGAVAADEDEDDAGTPSAGARPSARPGAATGATPGPSPRPTPGPRRDRQQPSWPRWPPLRTPAQASASWWRSCSAASASAGCCSRRAPPEVPGAPPGRLTAPDPREPS